jgi:hypothetical protein
MVAATRQDGGSGLHALDAAGPGRDGRDDRRLLLLAITIVTARLAGGILLAAGLLLAGMLGLGIVLAAWLARTVVIACADPWTHPDQAVPLSRFLAGRPWPHRPRPR